MTDEDLVTRWFCDACMGDPYGDLQIRAVWAKQKAPTDIADLR